MPVLDLLTYVSVKALLEAHLLERVAALEAALAARSTPALAPRNAARAADAERLREAVASVLAEHPGPAPLAAKAVLRALEQRGYTPVPSLRSVQRALGAVSDARATRHTVCGVRRA